MRRFVLILWLVLAAGCSQSGPTKEQRLAAAVTVLEAERAQSERIYRLLQDCKAARDKALAAAKQADAERKSLTGSNNADDIKRFFAEQQRINEMFDKELAEWNAKLMAQKERTDAAKAARDAIEAEK